MRILVIISSNEFPAVLKSNIIILKKYMDELANAEIDYAAISTKDDFITYDDIVQFKYKVVNPKRQLSKMCDFINTGLDYDWYIKFRPELQLMEQIPFESLCQNSINARARQYKGPLKLRNGMSVGGEGWWRHVQVSEYAETEERVELDDQIYIFHRNVIDAGAFDKILHVNAVEHEGFHDMIWKERNIHLNVIGIDAIFKYYKFNGTARSGDINIPRCTH